MSRKTSISANNRIRDFGAARGGNIAMIAAIMILPLLLAVGVGIDFGRQSGTKATVQEAADAAILRVARMKSADPGLTNEEMTERAREIFDTALEAFPELKKSDFHVAYDTKTGSFNLNFKGAMKTSLLGVVGVRSLDINTSSSVKYGKPPYMEVALVLDNTGSMNNDGKIAAAKSAAADLTKSVLAIDGTTSKVALVPFSQYVNVGSTGKGHFWMKDSGKSKRQNGETSEPDKSNSGNGNAYGQSNGNSGNGNSGNGNSGNGNSGNSATVAAADLAAQPKLNTWNGCVGSRSYPSNTQDSNFIGQPVPEVYNGTCPAEIQPLTSDKTLILSKINGMVAQGNTYIAGGLEWGWHVLTNQSPYREGVTLEELHKRDGFKYMVVLTDGENTRAPNYPTHDSTSRALADSLTKQLCDEIKRDQIVVYTVALGPIDAPTRALLQSCASSPANYFTASSSGDLSGAFAAIASSMRQLILTK